MGKRIKLGLIFSVDESWIGGTYYILNLVSALGTLPRKSQPIITILSSNRSNFNAAQKTGYAFLNYHNPFNWKRNLIEATINKISRLFTNKDIIDKRISPKNIDVLFPASDDRCFERIQNKVYWFPDFQHVVYPDFFKMDELESRNVIMQSIATGIHKLVLSSHAANHDWESLQLGGRNPVHIIPFAVTHPDIADIQVETLLEEFGLEDEYFIVSNQFWKHKNHRVVLKAAVQLYKQGVPCQFVFTGKGDDYRNPGYFESIEKFINEHRLTGTVKMLGLIDRRKQLKLMQHAKAVIQPSLFEGWSTVIEDAKSLGKMVIASDIPVHREQLISGVHFFEPHNENELTEKLKLVMAGDTVFRSSPYKNAIKVFGESFMKVISEPRN